QELGAQFVPVDPLRDTVSISARDIRANPMHYARYILPEARPYFTRRVVICGPESSGKSTLTRRLSERFGTLQVQQYVRAFQENVGRDLCLQDMLDIARAPRAAEDAAAMQSNGLLIVDTEVIITKLWSQVFFDAVPDGLEEMFDPDRYALYLLTEPHDQEW